MVRIEGDVALSEIDQSDIADCLALVAEAGWNQTKADWDYMLSVGRGAGVRDDQGRLIATSLVLPYRPGIGWIGMVLVNGPHRKRGHATRLLQNAIAFCRSEGLTPMLDATPAGREVYVRLGFIDGESIERWRGSGRSREDACVGALDIDQARRLDTEAFGADRRSLVLNLVQRPRAPGGQLDDAILLGRHGRTATQLGPLLSRDLANAARLCESAIDALAGPLLIDVPVREAGLRSMLEARGFTVERRFTRMSLGKPAPLGNAMRAIAGPELG